MPVRKFRDVSEMEDTLWYDRNDPALPLAIARLWSFAARMWPLQFPRGVHKYRSIEEANADRDRWEEANFRAFQERRRAKRGSPKHSPRRSPRRRSPSVGCRSRTPEA